MTEKKPTQRADKTPPHDRQAEVSLLGALMVDDEYVRPVRAIVSALEFYEKRHQIIFHAICKLDDDGSEVDVITVGDALVKSGQLETVGGRAYLVELMDGVYSAAHSERYAHIVKGCAKRRYLMRVASETHAAAASGEGDIEEHIQKMRAKLDDANRSSKFKPTLLVDKIDEMLKPAVGPKSGFRELDERIVCLENGTLTVVAGFTGMGKTTFAYDVARNVFKSGIRPVVFSLEMTLKQSAQRIASAETGFPLGSIRRGFVPDIWRDRLERALARCAIEFIEGKFIKAREIEGIVREMNRISPAVGLVIIDYLQLLTPDYFSGSRNLDVGQMARTLKLLALELDVPIVLLSQLRRIESVREPMLSDLRDSGEIEQHADGVIFVHRSAEAPESASLIVAKWRQDEANYRVLVPFVRQCSTFMPIEDSKQGALI